MRQDWSLEKKLADPEHWPLGHHLRVEMRKYKNTTQDWFLEQKLAALSSGLHNDDAKRINTLLFHSIID